MHNRDHKYKIIDATIYDLQKFFEIKKDVDRVKWDYVKVYDKVRSIRNLKKHIKYSGVFKK